MAVAYARGATARAQGEAATMMPNARYSDPRTPEHRLVVRMVTFLVTSEI